MATSKKLKLKLLVDKERKKVIFAESDKDFVDIIFSFLTMPVGSVIRILNKQSSFGCMDKLYESIENLDDGCFSSEACKEMLLRPLNACGWLCEDLILRTDESNPRTFFTCKKKECFRNSNYFFSLVPKARCECGETMDFSWYWKKEEHRGPNGDGVFLRGMLLDFLKRALVSKFPLSGMFFQKTDSIENSEFISKIPKIEDGLMDKESKKVKARIFVCKSSNKVLYAEAEEGFVNLLFSFLTIPLGTIVKLLSRSSSIGCLDNLYKSVENLIPDCKYFKLHPKLASME